MNSVSPRIARPRLFAPQQTICVGSWRVPVDPEHAAGRGVERHDVVRPLREVHDAVDDERRRLPGAGDRRLIHPLQLEVLRRWPA